VTDTAARGVGRFEVPLVAGVDCLDAVQLRSIALVRWTWRRTSSQGVPWELAFLFSFAVLLSRGCILGMTLDEVSLLLGRNCSISA
jgi:hypothetical protein